MMALGKSYLWPITVGWIAGYVFLMARLNGTPRDAANVVLAWLGALGIMAVAAGLIFLMFD